MRSSWREISKIAQSPLLDEFASVYGEYYLQLALLKGSARARSAMERKTHRSCANLCVELTRRGDLVVASTDSRFLLYPSKKTLNAAKSKRKCQHAPDSCGSSTDSPTTLTLQAAGCLLALPKDHLSCSPLLGHCIRRNGHIQKDQRLVLLRHHKSMQFTRRDVDKGPWHGHIVHIIAHNFTVAL